MRHTKIKIRLLVHGFVNNKLAICRKYCAIVASAGRIVAKVITLTSLKNVVFRPDSPRPSLVGKMYSLKRSQRVV